MWILLASLFSANASDLVVDGTTTNLSGNQAPYDNIYVINGGQLVVQDYNGTSRGSLTLTAKFVYVDPMSSIVADGAGYRGVAADDGEGTEPGAQGDSSGGGGGGHGGAGGDGSRSNCNNPDASGDGGGTYDTASATNVQMGSAGGAGQGASGGQGGNGGGAIQIHADEILMAGLITANGDDGQNNGTPGGGGSGGGIVLVADVLHCTGTLEAVGGNGASNGANAGGGGGGGVLRQFGGTVATFCGAVDVAGGNATGGCGGQTFDDGATGVSQTGTLADTAQDWDNDGFLDPSDCDPRDPNVAPGLTEVCNGIDDDCDTFVDESAPGPAVWYADTDGDGFGDAGTSQVTAGCTAPGSDWAGNDRDCDDGLATVAPGVTETCDATDEDCDGRVDDGVFCGGCFPFMAIDGSTYALCTPDTAWTAAQADCQSAQYELVAFETIAENDEVALWADAVDTAAWWIGANDSGGWRWRAGSPPMNVTNWNTGAGEPDGSGDCAVINGASGEASWRDRGCGTGYNYVCEAECTVRSFYDDNDGDGFGDPNVATSSCLQPVGTVANDLDCDDTFSTSNPASLEFCNGEDDDCNGTTDDNAQDALDWYADTDTDLYGDDAVTLAACSQPVGYVSDNTDCNDGAASIHPNAGELCDGIDQDCNGTPDDNPTNPTTWYRDFDTDLYGDPNVTQVACNAPIGYVPDNTDCLDSDATAHPGGTEVCDLVDDDCDSVVDDGVQLTFYPDVDTDGFGDPNAPFQACSPPLGYGTDDTDCDDTRISVHPGGNEICNLLDDDCDTQTDEGVQLTFYRDFDSDGFGDLATTVQACTAPTGYVPDSTDCDDNDPAATVLTTWYEDTDGDGFGDATVHQDLCHPIAGWVADGTDCLVDDDTAYPGAPETCDNVDDDCDGTPDDNPTDPSSWYTDDDGDGHGDPTTVVFECDAPTGMIPLGDDCDDTDASIAPGETEICDHIDQDCNGTEDDGLATATYWQDGDNDNYGRIDIGVVDCAAPTGFVGVSGDCNDSDPAVNPGATERCNSIDDDCDGTTDGPTSFDATPWYDDADGDGFGDNTTEVVDCAPPPGFIADGTDCDDTDPTVDDGSDFFADGDGDGFGDATDQVSACTAPTGYVPDDTDCDDARALVNPDADEVCNHRDDDCDGTTDEPESSDAVTWYADTDHDNFGDAADSQVACFRPLDHVRDDTDCDDTNPTTRPGAPEQCNTVDDDCNGTIDDNVTFVDWWPDTDGDGYGDVNGTPINDCTAPPNTIDNHTDCEDLDPGIHPNADEVCDGLDQDCDGLFDEDATDDVFWYRDADGDGQGDSADFVESCSQPTGYALAEGDCNDGDASVHTGATETCDGRDEDCDGHLDEDGGPTWYADADADGFGDAAVTAIACSAPTGYVDDATDCDDAAVEVNPDAVEVFYDGVDQDCDGGSDFDQDGDSFDVGDDPTHDCDDLNPEIHPGVTEVVGDGIDQDCDGVDASGEASRPWVEDSDAGDTATGRPPPKGCDCDAGSTSPGLAAAALLAVALVRRRRL